MQCLGRVFGRSIKYIYTYYNYIPIIFLSWDEVAGRLGHLVYSLVNQKMPVKRSHSAQLIETKLRLKRVEQLMGKLVLFVALVQLVQFV